MDEIWASGQIPVEFRELVPIIEWLFKNYQENMPPLPTCNGHDNSTVQEQTENAASTNSNTDATM